MVFGTDSEVKSVQTMIHVVTHKIQLRKYTIPPSH